MELDVTLLKRLPLIPTVIVVAAVLVMIRLGLWQVERMHEKDALLLRYAQAQNLPVIRYDGTIGDPRNLFRRVEGTCRRVEGGGMMAGRNAAGDVGWAHAANCAAIAPAKPGEEQMDGWKSAEVQVVIGWSREPREVRWAGGPYTGVLAPGAGDSVRVIADPPLAGLEANAKPDPRDIPNNHWSYAIQWFLFALVALVIYGLALRKRLAGA
ncbi:MAG TPA: SURF1 family cytochrome oxidase biogenesis protein [Novosphingobium sp.]|nr:SURF1 family cytochrome oxidase biogenesis protein [Novosphingobium sp.]